MNTLVIDERELVADFKVKNKEQFLCSLDKYEAYIAPVMRARGYRRVNQTERTVLFTFGEITFSRSRWTNGKRTRVPVDEKLGLKKHTRFSQELLYYVSKLSTMMTYRQVGIVVETLLGLHITKDTVLKVVKEAGHLLKQKEKHRNLKPEVVTTKIQSKYIYIEGDGVLVKCTEEGDERSNRDLTHFVVHTGRKQVAPNRFELQNKKEIIHINYEQAREDLLDYLYNHFEITPETVLITNSDNGKGYSKRIFSEIGKVLKIQRHEHFWDSYHVNEKSKAMLRPFPEELTSRLFSSIYSHKKDQTELVLDTCESLIEDEIELDKFLDFKQKLLRNFSQTKPAVLRGLPGHSIGIMESQHRKITYRMKHRGMYWSASGANTMSKMILLERLEDLRDLFFGDWRGNGETHHLPGMTGGQVKSRLNNKTNHSFERTEGRIYQKGPVKRFSK
ncbi:ISLre2 family transposase [Streptococcus suis]|uniref:ISLre2 family transposase n=1 Tax=Streptococcus suis TaxID=1307 RepID=UPI0038BA1633